MPSRGVINWVAFRAESHGACKRTQGTADASSLSFPNIHSSSPPHLRSGNTSLDPNYKIDNNAFRTCTHNRTALSKQTAAVYPLKSQRPVYLSTFNRRTLKMTGQQDALAYSIDSLGVDAGCVSETRTQNASTLIELSAPALSSTSGDAEAAAAGYTSVGIVLSNRAGKAFRDWIPVISRLCAVRLAKSDKSSRNREANHCMFVVSIYAPTNCSSDNVEDKFYDNLRALLRLARSSDIVVVCRWYERSGREVGSWWNEDGRNAWLGFRTHDSGERLLQTL